MPYSRHFRRSTMVATTLLEHFPIFGNRWGFPARRITDSRCGLVEEASLHDEISFQGHSRAGCFCG